MTTIWEPPGETLGEHIQRLTAIEAAAETVHTWQPLLIPGALQGYAYACGAIRSTSPALPLETVGERADVRRGRIDQLRAASTFIIDEGALYRPVGGTAALVDQLERLLAVEALQPRLTLRILPQGAEAHPGLAGPFTLYRAAGQRAVFVESLTSSEITTRPDDVAAYVSAWERLEGLALSPRQSLELIDGTKGALCRRLRTKP
ncbi:DUF5753 domain-containing protein [Streptomyces sp. NBC_01571]|uniref:DUF5753 domain-containing protein n=1 Tax=Streptomyces sp. NBC_01571 TaxID=2975883 RepID=UPI002258D712|nr:DUF5753 domain-containing protein [Streptomyces sp. NBC_01571]MCX4573093.1 DUF5753 domain-containing protein [Streptomyces sp. NBC_01571]